MSILTILLFFIYTWGLGFSALHFVKKPENFLERQFLAIAIGLGIIPILLILMNLLHIPLDWKILFVLSLIFPMFILFKRFKAKQLNVPKFQLTKSDLTIIAVILISLISLFIYASGAFSYPYLENEDPWGHAVGIKYVAMEKSAYDPPLSSRPDAIDPILAYIDPYPPGYDALLGILHQTSKDIMWTMKFFNALIISLGFVFFYLLAKQLTNNRNKALLATFILASIPSYLTHFIWAHALAITLFYPTILAFEHAKEDKKWLFIATILVASVWVSQNIEQPLKITTMIILYLIVTSIAHTKIWKEGFAALGAGILLSFAWWGAMVAKYGISGVVRAWQPKIAAAGAATAPSIIDRLTSIVYALVNPGGTASRAYTFSDFFIAQQNNMINSPIGIGIVLTLVTIAGVALILWKHRPHLLKQENIWITVALFWLLYTFWGVNGMTFPIPVARGAFRMWLLLAIPIALIATEGIYQIRLFAKSPAVKGAVVFIIIVGIIFTSGYQKYTLNTAVWPTSGAFVGSEPVEYASWFKTVPDNTKVFLYAPRDKLTIGFGKFSCIWCDDEIKFRDDIINKNAEEIHSFLKSKDYQYFIINPRMDTRDLGGVFGLNKTNTVLQQRYNEFAESGLFEIAHQKQNMFAVLRVT
jgi:hypothetical protein